MRSSWPTTFWGSFSSTISLSIASAMDGQPGLSNLLQNLPVRGGHDAAYAADGRGDEGCGRGGAAVTKLPVTAPRNAQGECWAVMRTSASLRRRLSFSTNGGPNSVIPGEDEQN